MHSQKVVNFGWALSWQESLMPAEVDHNYCQYTHSWIEQTWNVLYNERCSWTFFVMVDELSSSEQSGTDNTALFC